MNTGLILSMKTDANKLEGMYYRRGSAALVAVVLAFLLSLNTSASASSAIESKLEEIIIPQVNFSGMELTRVIEVLSELSAVYDPEGKGVNIVPLFDPNLSNPRVNISIKNLSLKRILGFVTNQVDATYSIGNDYVAINISTENQEEVVAPRDPFAAPDNAKEAGYDLFGSNLIENLEDLKDCSVSMMAVLADEGTDATEQDLLNANALALFTRSIYNTVVRQSFLSEEGELTTLKVSGEELNYKLLPTQFIKKINELEGPEDVYPGWIVFLTLIEQDYIKWRYADVVAEEEEPVGTTEVPEETQGASDSVEPNIDGDSRGETPGESEISSQNILQKFNITPFLLVFLLVGAGLGALSFSLLKPKGSVVAPSSRSSQPQPQPQKPRTRPLND